MHWSLILFVTGIIIMIIINVLMYYDKKTKLIKFRILEETRDNGDKWYFVEIHNGKFGVWERQQPKYQNLNDAIMDIERKLMRISSSNIKSSVIKYTRQISVNK